MNGEIVDGDAHYAQHTQSSPHHVSDNPLDMTTPQKTSNMHPAQRDFRTRNQFSFD
eukprot:m.367394 g.367394  ORF g.367394 m.367394 type:complete len:56 (-) comp20832_c0_seq3:262-429(-)